MTTNADKPTRWAIIVAGGSGRRFAEQQAQNTTTIPKQFQLLGEEPILMHTLHHFAAYNVVLVLPADQIAYWQSLCERYHFTQPHRIVEGGDTRSQSVLNGLAAVPDGAVVAIHDGVRPMVSSSLIERCYQLAEQHPCVIPAIVCADSARYEQHVIDRQKLLLIQTPQVFPSDILKEAYQFASFGGQTFTDDASVAETAGYPLYFTEGEKTNLKITTPDDLLLAQAILSQQTA